MVQIKKVLELAHHSPSVVSDFPDQRVATQVQTLDLWYQIKQTFVGEDAIGGQVESGEFNAALAQVHDGDEVLQVVVGEREVLQMGQFGQSLDREDIVVGQVQHHECFVVAEVLDPADHIVLQEQVLQMHQAHKVLYFPDHIVLQVEGLQVAVGLQVFDLLDALKVQVQLGVQLGLLVQSLLDAEQPQVVLAHYQRSALSVFQFSLLQVVLVLLSRQDLLRGNRQTFDGRLCHDLLSWRRCKTI